jgi:hypothetical protein
MTTAEFQRAFCRKRALPIVLDTDQFKRTLKDGVAKSVWIYYDGTKVYPAKTLGQLLSLRLTVEQELLTDLAGTAST